MLIFSMGVTVDGYINDREGAFDWGAPDDELFAFHLDRVASLGRHIAGRRLYEAMLPWETDGATGMAFTADALVNPFGFQLALGVFTRFVPLVSAGVLVIALAIVMAFGLTGRSGRLSKLAERTQQTEASHLRRALDSYLAEHRELV